MQYSYFKFSATSIHFFSFYPEMLKPITDMKKASSSESSSSSPPSESSEDEGEGMTLAQLTRQKAAPVNEDVGSATSVLSGENEEEDNEEEDKEEEYDEEELQEPRDLEEVLQDEVLPLKLQDVWMSGKINKYVDEEDGLRKWTCGFCGEVRKGWNATKALGHMIGGGAVMSRVVRRLPPNGCSCI